MKVHACGTSPARYSTGLSTVVPVLHSVVFRRTSMTARISHEGSCLTQVRSTLPAAAGDDFGKRKGASDLLIKALRRCQSMESLIKITHQISPEDLDLGMINSVLRHTATLHKQHGMTAGGDSTESGALTDLLSNNFVPASMKLIQDMSWSDLSAHLWAWATLHHHPGRAWVETALDHASRRLGFSPAAAPAAQVSVALWALHRLGVRPGKRWVKKCRKGLLGQWRECPPRPMTLALWSLSRMGDRPPEDWISATLSHILLHAVLYSSPEVWRMKPRSLKPRLPGGGDPEATGSEGSQRDDDNVVARDRHRDSSAGVPAGVPLQQPALREVYRRVGLNSSASAAAAAIAVLESRLRGAPGGSVAAQWFVRARFHALTHKRYGGMTAQQYMMSLYSLAALQYRPSDKWMLAYLSGSGSLLGRQALLDLDSLNLRDMQEGDDPAAGGGRGRRGQGVGVKGVRRFAWKAVDPRPGIRPPGFEDPREERLHWQQVLRMIQRGQQQRKRPLKPSEAPRDEATEPSSSSSSSPAGEGAALGRGSNSPDLVGSRDLACLLWCMARIRHEPPSWWIRLYEAVLLPRLNTFSVQEMVTVLYGYGALRRKPPRLLLRNLLQLIRTRWKHLGPRGASNLLVALARLKMPPHPGWVKGLMKQTILSIGAGRSPALSATVSSASPQRSRARGGLLTSEGAARCLWALGTLGIDPGPDVIEVLIAEVESSSPDMPRADASLDVADEDDEDHPDALYRDHPDALYRTWRMQLRLQAKWGAAELGYALEIN